MLYFLGKWICYIAGMFKYKIVVAGQENIPKEGGFILACNHIRWTDPIVLGVKCPHRVYFMAKEELFRKKFYAFILRNLGVFSVSRGTGDAASLSTGIDIIKQGKVMGIFPEGTRSKTGELLRPKSGVIMIAGQTKADILPAAVRIVKKDRGRDIYYISFGKIIKNEQISVSEVHSLAQIKNAGKLLMGRIQELLDKTKENDVKNG